MEQKKETSVKVIRNSTRLGLLSRTSGSLSNTQSSLSFVDRPGRVTRGGGARAKRAARVEDSEVGRGVRRDGQSGVRAERASEDERE